LQILGLQPRILKNIRGLPIFWWFGCHECIKLSEKGFLWLAGLQQATKKRSMWKWYFVNKIVLTYCEKKLF
jgi:hypothetical protein